MIYIPYFLLLSFLGLVIMSNIGNVGINKILSIIGICIVAPLGLIPLHESMTVHFLGLTLQAINQNDTGYFFTIAFTLTLVCGVTYYLSLQKVNYKEIGFAFILSGCAITAVSSNDLIIIIILMQIIPIISAIMVAMNPSSKSKRTAIQIIALNLLGNLLFIIGADSYISLNGTTAIRNVAQMGHYSTWLMLLGLLVLIATPPFAPWLVDELSVSSAGSSIFLSIFTPKVALIILIKAFAGAEILLYVGIILSVYGVVFSLFTPNFRKILSYAILHQLGFILIVLAVSSSLDVSALNIFIFSHILYELCFFIIAAICNNYFKHDNLYKMRGFFHYNPTMGVILLLASLNSLGFPFTSGFIGKSLISDVMAASGNTFIYYFTFFSAAAHALHVGFKIFYTLSLQKPDSNNIEKFKNYKLRISHILPLCLLLVLTIAHYIVLSFLNPNINSLENIYHEIRVAIIGIVMFAFLVRFTNHEKELSFYETNHKLIIYINTVLSMCADSIRNYCNKIEHNSTVVLSKFARSTLLVEKIYYNSRLPLCILLIIILFSLILIW